MSVNLLNVNSSTNENCLTNCQFFSPFVSPIILVLSASNIFAKFRGGHPLRGRSIKTAGCKKFRGFQAINGYMSQTIKAIAPYLL